MICPCDSGLAYETCCGVLHQGGVADSAKALMRSRYSAFVLGDVDYVIRTTVPAQQGLLDKVSLQAWADTMTWTGLDIKSHIAKIGKRHAQVHFCASFIDKAGECGVHDELSAFVKIGERWYFLDPTVPQTLTNKQPCLCGSGEKFKQCCGKFLS